MELGLFFAGGQDCARVGVLGAAAKRPEFHPFIVGGEDIDPEDGSSGETNVSCCPHHGILPSRVVLHICEPSIFFLLLCVRTRRQISGLAGGSSKRSSGPDRKRGFPIVCGAAGPQKSLPFQRNLCQGFLDDLVGFFVRKLVEGASVQRRFHACASTGLHVWMQ